MAKDWYLAVCDKCMEAKYVMVSNPSCTAAYLGDKDAQVQAFLNKHYGCDLRLVWRDDQLDKLWEEGYTNKDLEYE